MRTLQRMGIFVPAEAGAVRRQQTEVVPRNNSALCKILAEGVFVASCRKLRR